MNILWVKAGGLMPPDSGGRIRSYQIAKALARSHEVTVYTFYAEQPNDPHGELRKIFKRVECRPLQIPAGRGLGEALLYARAFFSPQPYTMVKFCKPWIARDLRRLLGETPFDVVVCDATATGGVIPWDFPCRKVLSTQNVEAQIWKRHYELARNPVWKAVCRREYLSMERIEREYLARADRVLAVSEVDRKFFSTLIPPGKINVIPNGVDVRYFHASGAPEKGTELVFTGAMDWIPNEDAIFYFAQQILPLIRREIPDVSLTVVGRQPSQRLRNLAARTPGLRVTGRVDDVRPYMERAAVYVVPLRVGGGTRLKIFEAMAMGKVVVSTSIGAEGLDVCPGEDIAIADTPASFSDAVVDLLRNGQRRRTIAEAAVRKAQQYDWSAIADRLGRVLGQTAEPQSVTG